VQCTAKHSQTSTGKIARNITTTTEVYVLVLVYVFVNLASLREGSTVTREDGEVDSDEGEGEEEEEVYVNAMHRNASQGTSQPVPEMSTSQGGTSPLPHHHHHHGGMNGPSSSVDALRAVLAKIVGSCTSVQLGMAKVFITVAQAVFTSTLASGLRAQIPGIDPTTIRDAGFGAGGECGNSAGDL
jgi:hypothetical protein